MFINVSRTRIALTREVLRAEWRLPHRGSENNDAQWCHAARAHGFASLQFLARNHSRGGASPPPGEQQAPHPPRSELVFCAGPCVAEESRTPCPGVPLYRSDGTACTCDESWPLLRCLEDVVSASSGASAGITMGGAQQAAVSMGMAGMALAMDMGSATSMVGLHGLPHGGGQGRLHAGGLARAPRHAMRVDPCSGNATRNKS